MPWASAYFTFPLQQRTSSTYLFWKSGRYSEENPAASNAWEILSRRDSRASRPRDKHSSCLDKYHTELHTGSIHLGRRFDHLDCSTFVTHEHTNRPEASLNSATSHYERDHCRGFDHGLNGCGPCSRKRRYHTELLSSHRRNDARSSDCKRHMYIEQKIDSTRTVSAQNKTSLTNMGSKL